MSGIINRGPVYSLYVGSRDGNAFSDGDRLEVTDLVSTIFESFTVLDADGFYQGRSVATLVIKIATDNDEIITELARQLGRKLNQQFIGVEASGKYQSISTG